MGQFSKLSAPKKGPLIDLGHPPPLSVGLPKSIPDSYIYPTRHGTGSSIDGSPTADSPSVPIRLEPVGLEPFRLVYCFA